MPNYASMLPLVGSVLMVYLSLPLGVAFLLATFFQRLWHGTSSKSKGIVLPSRDSFMSALRPPEKLDPKEVCAFCKHKHYQPYQLPCGHSYCEACVKNMFVEKTLTSCPLCNQKLFDPSSPLFNKLVAYTEQTQLAALILRVVEQAIAIAEGLVFGANCNCGNFHISTPLLGLAAGIATFFTLRHNLDPEKMGLQDNPRAARYLKLARLATVIIYAACCSVWVKSQWQDSLQRRQGEILGW